MGRDHQGEKARLLGDVGLHALEVVEGDGRLDRRDELAEDAVLRRQVQAEAGAVHEVVEAHEHLDPVVGGGERHLHLGDDAVGAVGVADAGQFVARKSSTRGSASIVTTRRRMMLPKSRSAPQWQDPIPPEPPATKPPMVAVAKVEGVMLSSCPECSRVSRSRSRITQPGSR
jgi:hypothetical protein